MMFVDRSPCRVSGVALCIALGLALAACGKDDEKTAQAPPLVEVKTLAREDVPLTYSFVGQTAGSLSVQVRAQVGGILKKRNYVEGDYVEKGQVLFEIDPDTYRAAYEQAQARQAQAEAAYDQANRDWERIKPLYARNAVSQRDRDTAQTSFNAAKADLEAARAEVTQAGIQLGYAFVTAPISGYTSKESWTEGNLITTGGNAGLLTEINQMDPLFVDFSIASNDYQLLRSLVTQGKAVQEGALDAQIRFSDGSVYPQQGEVTFVDTRVDTATSVVKARAVFPNPNRAILPGQYVRLTVGGVTYKDVLRIPQTAYIQTQNGAIVMALDKDGLPQARPVTLGRGIGKAFLVESGLEAGDRIIVEGVNKIRPGQPVRINDHTGDGKAAGPEGTAGAGDRNTASADGPARDNRAGETSDSPAQQPDKSGDSAQSGQSGKPGAAAGQAEQDRSASQDQGAEQATMLSTSPTPTGNTGRADNPSDNAE